MGKEHQGDCKSPFLTKSRNGLTPIRISQMMTSYTLTKTEPVGDASQLTALLQSTNDDDDDDEVGGNTIHSLLTDTSIKRTLRVGPCLSLLPLFDSL